MTWKCRNHEHFESFEMSFNNTFKMIISITILIFEDELALYKISRIEYTLVKPTNI